MQRAKPLPVLPISSDAPSDAPSGIGKAELIDSDLQVVGQYRELAVRHDSLVDWVERELARQAGR